LFIRHREPSQITERARAIFQLIWPSTSSARIAYKGNDSGADLTIAAGLKHPALPMMFRPADDYISSQI